MDVTLTYSSESEIETIYILDKTVDCCDIEVIKYDQFYSLKLV